MSIGDENAKKQGQRTRLVIGIVLGVCCLAYGYWYLASTMPDPDGVSECRAITASVESAVTLPQSASSPGVPAIFCDKGIRGLLLKPYNRVRVYGVVDTNEEEALAAALSRAKSQLKTKPIILELYEKENWVAWSDPTTGRKGGQRGPEAPIRRTVIE